MNRAMSDDLDIQFQKPISMLRFTIEEFDDEQWVSGISWFQTPARVAYHTVEALDAYFSDSSSEQEFDYGLRYLEDVGWELPDGVRRG